MRVGVKLTRGVLFQVVATGMSSSSSSKFQSNKINLSD